VNGSDGNVWQWRQGPGVPAGWCSLGAPRYRQLAWSPDAFSWRPQHETVIIATVNPGNWVDFWKKTCNNGTWTDWIDLGAPTTIPVNQFGAVGSRPGTTSRGAPTFEIFFRTYDYFPHIWHGYSLDGNTIAAWQDWGYPPGVQLTGGVDAASWGSLRVDVVALGTDGNVWQRAWDNYTLYGWWSGWGNPGEPMNWAAGPGAVGLGDNRLDVAVGTLTSPSLRVYDRFWNWGLGPWATGSLASPYSTIDISSW
jgi:hypothetical protein